MSATKSFDRRWMTAVASSLATGGDTWGDQPSAKDEDDGLALVGRTLGGKFLVEAIVGSGAMGHVYRARHVVLDKAVAVKVIRAEYSSNEVFRTRFLQEALTASRLEHPNTVQILDYGAESDGVTYIVMELLRGRTLADVIDNEGRQRPERIVALMSQVLSAIGKAHEAGIVHRDLKPENVMLVTQSEEDDASDVTEVAKVMDFGVASVVDGSEWSAQSERPTDEIIMGTPGYMSPEQQRGMKLDGRSDVYACGVIAYELLTGRPPFLAESVAELIRVSMSEDPADPCEVTPLCDARVAGVVMRALARDRDARFASAREMRSALKSAISARGATALQGLGGEEALSTTDDSTRVPVVRRPTPATMPELPEVSPVEPVAMPGATATRSTAALATSSPTRNRWLAPAAILAIAAAATGTVFMLRKGDTPTRTNAPAVRTTTPAASLPTASSRAIEPTPPTPEPRSAPHIDPPAVAAVEPTPMPVQLTPTVSPAPHVDSARARVQTRGSEAHLRANNASPTATNPEPATSNAQPALPEPTPAPVPVATPVPTPAAPVVAVNRAPIVAPAPPAPRVFHSANASVEGLRVTAGAPRGPLVSRGDRAAEALGRCASREVAARGANAGLDATRHLHVVVDVRDERLDDVHLQGGPAWLSNCASAVRDSFAGALPAADDTEYTVTVDVALSPVP